MATLFAVLAEPNRRRILDLLRSGHRSVGEIVEALGPHEARMLRVPERTHNHSSWHRPDVPFWASTERRDRTTNSDSSRRAHIGMSALTTSRPPPGDQGQSGSVA